MCKPKPCTKLPHIIAVMRLHKVKKETIRLLLVYLNVKVEYIPKTLVDLEKPQHILFDISVEIQFSCIQSVGISI